MGKKSYQHNIADNCEQGLKDKEKNEDFTPSAKCKCSIRHR